MKVILYFIFYILFNYLFLISYSAHTRNSYIHSSGSHTGKSLNRSQEDSLIYQWTILTPSSSSPPPSHCY